MDFPESFFEAETRCGYYVSSQMKRCWAAQLEILSDIAEVCNRYGLEWFAGWGTLLGCARHGGYIPWDDDLDIYMKRPDFERFLEVAEKELPENYSLLNYRNDPAYDQFLTRVLNGREITLNAERMEKYHGFPYVSGVDIFPLDFMSRNKEEDDIQQIMIQTAQSVYEALRSPETTDEHKENAIRVIEELCNITIDRQKDPAWQVYMYCDKLLQLFGEEDADRITLMPLWATEGVLSFPKECFERAVWMPFENVFIKMPVGYREVVQTLYGNYWEYARSWGSHNYPYYGQMEQQVKDAFGFGPLRFPTEQFHEALQRKEQVCANDEMSEKTIVFLTYRASMWKSLKGIYDAAVASGCKTYVIPVPYANRHYDKSLGDYHVDTQGFAKNVPLVEADRVDLTEMHPDVIFFQNPYDEYNDSSEVEERFFARNLREVTGCLVYVPGFDQDEIYRGDDRARMGFVDFGAVAGVYYADYTYVASELMWELYIEEWTKITGVDTKNIWENRIRTLGNPADDMMQKDIISAAGLEDEWKDLTLWDDGTMKDVVLYRTTDGRSSVDGEAIIEKIADTIDLFAKRKDDSVILWCPDSALEVYFEKERPDLADAYQDLIRRFKEEKLGIFDGSNNLARAVAMSRAYIGDPGSLVPVFRRKGRPIMIQTQDFLYQNEGEEGHMYPMRGAVLGDKYYFYSNIYPGLYAADLNTEEVTFVSELPEHNSSGVIAYRDLIAQDNKLYLLPCMAKELVIYDTIRAEAEMVSLWSESERRQNFVFGGGAIAGGYIFLFQNGGTVFRIDMASRTIERNDTWAEELPFTPNYAGSVSDGTYVYTMLTSEDGYIKTHIETFAIEVVLLNNARTRYYGACIHQGLLCMTPIYHGDLKVVKPQTDEEIGGFDMKQIYNRGKYAYVYDLLSVDDELWMFPLENSRVVRLNLSTGEWKEERFGLSEGYADKTDAGMGATIFSCARQDESHIFVTMYQKNELLIYDKLTKESRQIRLTMPQSIRRYSGQWLKEYAIGSMDNHPAYIEQRYFGIPEFLDNLHEISLEMKKEAAGSHVGEAIFEEVMG